MLDTILVFSVFLKKWFYFQLKILCPLNTNTCMHGGARILIKVVVVLLYREARHTLLYRTPKAIKSLFVVGAAQKKAS